MSQPLSPEERQAALDNLPVEYIEKLEALESAQVVVDPEWMLLAEFALLYGWEAYMAAKHDKIDGSEMTTLIAAGRKLKAKEKYDMAHAVYIGAGSVQSKKSGEVFKQLTREIIKEIKVDS